MWQIGYDVAQVVSRHRRRTRPVVLSCPHDSAETPPNVQHRETATCVGDVPGLVQDRKNTFYLDDRVRSLPGGAVRVVPPGYAGT